MTMVTMTMADATLKRGNWHIINHAYSNVQYENCGSSYVSAHFFSTDGKAWYGSFVTLHAHERTCARTHTFTHVRLYLSRCEKTAPFTSNLFLVFFLRTLQMLTYVYAHTFARFQCDTMHHSNSLPKLTHPPKKNNTNRTWSPDQPYGHKVQYDDGQ